MTPLDVLMAMRGLIAQPERWTKGALARAEDDRKVSLSHPHACKFSLEGALYRVHHYTKAPACQQVHGILTRVVDPRRVVSMETFNNALGTTHWTVLQKLDHAIRLMGGTPPVFEDE